MQRVIDVSYHNGKVNWELVKAAGYHAILRAGYGTDRSDQDDTEFKRNADACERLGIPWGAYLYSYADNTARAMSEAAHMIRLLEPYKDARYRLYPCFFDAEQAGTEDAAAGNAVIWCRQLAAEGYDTGVYANEHWWSTVLKIRAHGVSVGRQVVEPRAVGRLGYLAVHRPGRRAGVHGQRGAHRSQPVETRYLGAAYLRRAGGARRYDGR